MLSLLRCSSFTQERPQGAPRTLSQSSSNGNLCLKKMVEGILELSWLAPTRHPRPSGHRCCREEVPMQNWGMQRQALFVVCVTTSGFKQKMSWLLKCEQENYSVLENTDCRASFQSHASGFSALYNLQVRNSSARNKVSYFSLKHRAYYK